MRSQHRSFFSVCCRVQGRRREESPGLGRAIGFFWLGWNLSRTLGSDRYGWSVRCDGIKNANEDRVWENCGNGRIGRVFLWIPFRIVVYCNWDEEDGNANGEGVLENPEMQGEFVSLVRDYVCIFGKAAAKTGRQDTGKSAYAVLLERAGNGFPEGRERQFDCLRDCCGGDQS